MIFFPHIWTIRETVRWINAHPILCDVPWTPGSIPGLRIQVYTILDLSQYEPPTWGKTHLNNCDG